MIIIIKLRQSTQEDACVVYREVKVWKLMIFPELMIRRTQWKADMQLHDVRIET